MRGPHRRHRFTPWLPMRGGSHEERFCMVLRCGSATQRRERPVAPSVQWRPVPRAPRYEVSDDGRVRNRLTGHILLPQPGGGRGAYLTVLLGRGDRRYVHRVVAEAWHGPPPDSTDHADHLDFDPDNNSASNLRWLSATLNIGRQIRRGATAWELVADEEPPPWYVPPTDVELAEADAHFAAGGW